MIEQQRLRIILEAVNRTQGTMRSVVTGLNTARTSARNLNAEVARAGASAQTQLSRVGSAAAGAGRQITQLGGGFKGLCAILSGLSTPLQFVGRFLGSILGGLRALGSFAGVVFGGISIALKALLGVVASVVRAVGGVLVSAFSRLAGVAGGVARAALAGFVGGMVAIAARGVAVNTTLERLTNSFGTMLRNTRRAKDFLRELRGEAVSSIGSFVDLSKNAKTLLGFGFKRPEITPMLRTLGDTAVGVAGSEGSSEMRDRLAVIFGQIKSKGVLQGEEAMQLAESGIPVREMLGVKPGQDFGDMKMSASQAIPKLLAGLNARFGGLQAKEMDNVSGKSATIGDMLDDLSARVSEGFTERLKRAMDLLSEFLGWLQKTREGGVILQALTNVLNLAGDALIFLASQLQNAGYWLSGFIQSGQGAKLLAEAAGWVQVLHEAVRQFVDFVSGGRGLEGIWERFRDTASTAIQQVWGLWQGFSATFSYLADHGDEIFKKFEQGLYAVRDAIDAIVGSSTVFKTLGFLGPLLGGLGGGAAVSNAIAGGAKAGAPGVMGRIFPAQATGAGGASRASAQALADLKGNPLKGMLKGGLGGILAGLAGDWLLSQLPETGALGGVRAFGKGALTGYGVGTVAGLGVGAGVGAIAGGVGAIPGAAIGAKVGGIGGAAIFGVGKLIEYLRTGNQPGGPVRDAVGAGYQGARALGAMEREVVGGQVTQWWDTFKADPAVRGLGKAFTGGYQQGARDPNILGFKNWDPVARQSGYSKQWLGRINGAMAPYIEAENTPPATLLAGDSYGTGIEPSVTTIPLHHPADNAHPFSYTQTRQAIRAGQQAVRSQSGIRTLDGGFLPLPGINSGDPYDIPGASFSPVATMTPQPGGTPVQIVINLDTNLQDLPARAAQALQGTLDRMVRGPFAAGVR